jgi:hypothetical protein
MSDKLVPKALACLSGSSGRCSSTRRTSATVVSGNPAGTCKKPSRRSTIGRRRLIEDGEAPFWRCVREAVRAVKQA